MTDTPRKIIASDLDEIATKLTGILPIKDQEYQKVLHVSVIENGCKFKKQLRSPVFKRKCGK